MLFEVNQPQKLKNSDDQNNLKKFQILRRKNLNFQKSIILKQFFNLNIIIVLIFIKNNTNLYTLLTKKE
jgi:hypothetical protein